MQSIPDYHDKHFPCELTLIRNRCVNYIHRLRSQRWCEPIDPDFSIMRSGKSRIQSLPQVNPHDCLVPRLTISLLIKLPRLSDSLVCWISSPFRQGIQRARAVNSDFGLGVCGSLIGLGLSCWTHWCFGALGLTVLEMKLLPGAGLSCR